MNANLNFIRQQGFKDATPKTCELQFPALIWQPRVLLVLVLFGLLLETGWYYLGLGGILWCSALFPKLNPFDAIYNRLVARRRGTPPLTPAPGPRRFAMGMAGTFALAIGFSMRSGRLETAWTLLGILLLAQAALVFGRFCFGSYVFHLITGQFAFANRTLPWCRGEEAEK